MFIMISSKSNNGYKLCPCQSMHACVNSITIDVQSDSYNISKETSYLIHVYHNTVKSILDNVFHLCLYMHVTIRVVHVKMCSTSSL